MSWTITEHIGELRPWPDAVHVFRGDGIEVRPYLPRVSTMRIVSDVSDGVGNCRCGFCDTVIDPYDAYCRHCGTELTGTVYTGKGSSHDLA